MSTYLVAFIIGPFEETRLRRRRRAAAHRLSPRQRAPHRTRLEAGAFALRFFSNYFDIPTRRQVGHGPIPDFMQGAMENLGCITYRMPDLLIDPAKASLAEMKRVAKV